MPLVICPSCREHVRPEDAACPHCATGLRTVMAPRPALAILGLVLAACPADDYHEDLPGESTSTTTATTSGTETTMATESGTGTSTADVGTSLASEAAYGLPQTESDSFTESSSSDTSGTPDSSGSSDSSTGDTTGTTTEG